MESSEKGNRSSDGLHKPDQAGNVSDGLRILARLIARHHIAKSNSPEEASKVKQDTPD